MPETLATLMRPAAVILHPEDRVRAALERMLTAKETVAPVLSDAGALVGVLSQKDCFRPALAAAYHQSWQGRVADHMTPEVVTLGAGTDLVAAAEQFLAQPFRVFPVTEGPQLLGMIDRADLLRAFLRHG